MHNRKWQICVDTGKIVKIFHFLARNFRFRPSILFFLVAGGAEGRGRLREGHGDEKAAEYSAEEFAADVCRNVREGGRKRRPGQDEQGKRTEVNEFVLYVENEGDCRHGHEGDEVYGLRSVLADAARSEQKRYEKGAAAHAHSAEYSRRRARKGINNVFHICKTVKTGVFVGKRRLLR